LPAALRPRRTRRRPARLGLARRLAGQLERPETGCAALTRAKPRESPSREARARRPRRARRSASTTSGSKRSHDPRRLAPARRRALSEAGGRRIRSPSAHPDRRRRASANLLGLYDVALSAELPVDRRLQRLDECGARREDFADAPNQLISYPPRSSCCVRRTQVRDLARAALRETEALGSISLIALCTERARAHAGSPWRSRRACSIAAWLLESEWPAGAGARGRGTCCSTFITKPAVSISSSASAGTRNRPMRGPPAPPLRAEAAKLVVFAGQSPPGRPRASFPRSFI